MTTPGGTSCQNPRPPGERPRAAGASAGSHQLKPGTGACWCEKE